MEYFGKTYRDKITGFVGLATAYTMYITGCNRILLEPIAHDNAFKEGEWFDVQRLELLENLKVEIKNDLTGGGKNAPRH